MPPVGNVFDSERNEQLTRHIEDDICSTGGL